MPSRLISSPGVASGVLLSCVLVVALSETWAFLSMRAVMAVGGACADGGPYVSAQPCPKGAGLIGLAIPLMLLAAFLGSFVGVGLHAPNLLVPLWAFLFGSLGWNFWEFGLTGDPSGATVAGWIVCGVVFWLMAAPAVVLVAMGFKSSPRFAGLYTVMSALGVVLGVVGFHALV